MRLVGVLMGLHGVDEVSDDGASIVGLVTDELDELVQARVYRRFGVRITGLVQIGSAGRAPAAVG